ncbi:hypothetical protein PsAD2_01749 [Pseudovibrio axinellae]|uniref:Uncharacterized protein n=1 Tax=Pseudovibrio axinellae TaxID=989403 RepID=A0A165Z381_9HYPH|nr:hypothetical protein [Pseudovibrio axinellae]KZL19471.1 hypothetical protein PsAD2_01749 [Pseudovibrio axinellae]SEQ28115.1 hypothetical protein SAMN05421798_102310 [Pseudovibrio axinellae]
MSYSTAKRPVLQTLNYLMVISIFSWAGALVAFAQEVPVPPKKATPAAVAACEEEHMKREGVEDLGSSQYREKIRDLCNKSVLGAPNVEVGKEPATNDYYYSADGGGFVYELSEDCDQVRIQNELIFICPEGKFKPVIRNNQSGFMPYEEPKPTVKPSETP